MRQKKPRTIALRIKGRTIRQTYAKWAAETGISALMLYKRIDRGWSPKRALTTPAVKPMTLTARGRTRPVEEWARLSGVTVNTIYARLARGWPDERAVTGGA